MKWTDAKIRRVATGWSLSDIDQLDDKSYFAEQKRIVDFNLDGKKLVAEIAAAGAEVFTFHAKSHSGNVWFNSKTAKKFSALGDRDLLNEIVSECRRRGISTVGMFQINCDKRTYNEHPEWRQINNEEGNDSATYNRVCFNNPGYREQILSIITEAVANYPLDGIMLDELDFNGRYGGGQMCYCSHCREIFRRKFSCEMPLQENWDNPDWKNFIRFRFDCLTEFIKEVRTRIKSVNPDVMLTIISYSGYNLPWQRLQPVETFSEYLDFFSLDTGGNILTSFYSRFFRAYSREKAEIMGAITPALAHIAAEPSLPNISTVKILGDAMTVVANNLAWNMDIGYRPLPPDNIVEPSIISGYKAIADEIARREKWLTGKQESLAETALYYSEDSKIFYGRDNICRYTDEFMGYFKALLESHNIFDIVGAKHLNAERLKQYKLLVMPNTACLSASQLEEIGKFTANGGALLASYKTSLFDENGNQKRDFGLASVLDVAFVSDGPGGDYLPEKLIAGQRSNTDRIEYGFMKMKKGGKISAGVETLTALFTPTTIVKPGGNTETAGDFFRRKISASNHIPGFKESYMPDEKPECIAALNSKAKGRTAYLAPKFGSLYWKLAFNYAGSIIQNTIAWLLDGREVIKVSAPPCVEVTAFRQGKNRTIIHFVNCQTAARKVIMHALYQPRIYESEDILPVHDVRIEYRPESGPRIKKAYLAPEMIDLRIEKMDQGGIACIIPKVEIHTMLVLETNG